MRSPGRTSATTSCAMPGPVLEDAFGLPGVPARVGAAPRSQGWRGLHPSAAPTARALPAAPDMEPFGRRGLRGRSLAAGQCGVRARLVVTLLPEGVGLVGLPPGGRASGGHWAVAGAPARTRACRTAAPSRPVSRRPALWTSALSARETRRRRAADPLFCNPSDRWLRCRPTSSTASMFAPGRPARCRRESLGQWRRRGARQQRDGDPAELVHGHLRWFRQAFRGQSRERVDPYAATGTQGWCHRRQCGRTSPLRIRAPAPGPGCGRGDRRAAGFAQSCEDP